MVDVGSYVAGYVPDVPVPVPLYCNAVPVATGWGQIVINRKFTVDLTHNSRYSAGQPLSCRFQNWSQNFLSFSIDAFF